MTDPGKLDRRLVLEAPSEIDDGAGGVTRSFVTAATVWAQVKPVAAHADVAAASLGAIITHTIVIRAPRLVTILHRFRDGARIFRIAAVSASADRRFLEIHAEERGD